MQPHHHPHSGRWGNARRGGHRALTPGPEESDPFRGGRGSHPSFLAGRPAQKGQPRPKPPAQRVRAPGGDRRYSVRRCTPDYHRCAVGPIPSPLRGDRIFPTVPSRLGFTSFNQAQRRHARRPVTCSSPFQGGTFPACRSNAVVVGDDCVAPSGACGRRHLPGLLSPASGSGSACGATILISACEGVAFAGQNPPFHHGGSTGERALRTHLLPMGRGAGSRGLANLSGAPGILRPATNVDHSRGSFIWGAHVTHLCGTALRRLPTAGGHADPCGRACSAHCISHLDDSRICLPHAARRQFLLDSSRNPAGGWRMSRPY